MHYLLIYDIAPDYPERRVAFREAHLRLAWQAASRGELVLGGAVGDPPESALLLFCCDSDEIPAAFARVDPYVLNGVVTRWKVRPWSTVVGSQAATPVHLV